MEFDNLHRFYFQTSTSPDGKGYPSLAEARVALDNVNRRRSLSRFWRHRRRTLTSTLLAIRDENLLIAASALGPHWTPDTGQLETPVHKRFQPS